MIRQRISNIHMNAPDRSHHFEVGAADVEELLGQAVDERPSLPSGVSRLQQRRERIRGRHLLPARLLNSRLRPSSRAGVMSYDVLHATNCCPQHSQFMSHDHLCRLGASLAGGSKQAASLLTGLATLQRLLWDMGVDAWTLSAHTATASA